MRRARARRKYHKVQIREDLRFEVRPGHLVGTKYSDVSGKRRVEVLAEHRVILVE
jgi:hypothetical protein